MRAEIEMLRSERLAYEQEGIQTREALARSQGIRGTSCSAGDSCASPRVAAHDLGVFPSEDPYEEATQQLAAAAARRPGPTMAHGIDCNYVKTRLRDIKRRMMAALELVNLRKDRAAVRAKIEVLRSERLAYEQEGIQTREALAISEAYCRALEARVAVLETHTRRLEWQRQAAHDFVVHHIMRTQALEAGARDDTLEDTVFVPEFKHPEDLVPAEDEAPASLLPPGFLSPRIRPLSPRALGAKMNAIASSLYHSLHPSGTPLLLPIPLSTPSTSRRAGIPKADTLPRNRPLLATPRPGCEVRESFAAARRPGPTMAHEVDCSYMETRLQDTEKRMMAALELVNLRISYQTREALAKSEAYCRALEARVAVLETHTRRLEWQRQAAHDFVVHHIMRTQALEAGARDDTLEDTGHYACDCKSTGNTNATNNRGGNGPNPRGNGCFECGNFKRDCPKLNNKNGGNGNAQGWVYAVGNAERNGNAAGNPNLNVVTNTFLLNNRYASILFDTGV
nr:hypothetical protein [Tanacetum cinerariifolium]